MIDAKRIGERIRALRLARGLSQSEFAERLSVSFQAVSGWERGVSLPDIDNVVRIAELFGITVDEILRSRGEELYLAVDGGGTKTEFAVVSVEGNVVTRIVESGCNPNDIGYDKAFAILKGGIDRILSKVRSVRGMFLGIAGASAGNHAARLATELRKCYPNSKIEVKSDVFNLFAMCDGAAMAVISGTGSAVFVKRAEEFKRLGGWGYLLDNAGSAYDIGREVIRAALYEEDRGCAPSLLTSLLKKRLGTDKVWDHLGTIYSEGKPYIAELATVAFEAYRRGDATAARIIDESARALAELLNAGVELYGAEPIAVASGGLFTHYTDVMREHIERYSRVKLIIGVLPPVYGAARSACLLCGVETPESFYENFKNTYGGLTQ